MGTIEFETEDDAPVSSALSLRVHQPHLFVVLEADRPGSRGARHSLVGVDEIVIGRGTERAIDRRKTEGKTVLTVYVPGRWMSSTHARMIRVGRRWVIEDAGSRNGTFVNGQRITRTELQDRDVVEAGHTFFVVRDAILTPASAPSDVDASKIAGSPGLRTLLPALEQHQDAALQVARRSNVPILLLGETGTGKEVLARALHAQSGRRGAMVAVNCGALPLTLVEGLLFGHAKGAFSGALRDELGFVRSADGGTLFLDEIGDLPAASQAALLRVLQEGEVVPVGSTRPIKVDVRVIAATHRPIETLAADGQFRADLLARLKGFTHHLAPLRERREDLGVILADILEHVAGDRMPTISLAPGVARAFLAYRWPLNIRELQQCLSAAVALAADGNIAVRHLPAELGALGSGDAASDDPKPTGAPPASPTPRDDQELRTTLERQLTEHAGNVAAVARAMGKAPIQVHRWMKRFGIDPNTFRAP